jgi:hypothetical protein
MTPGDCFSTLAADRLVNSGHSTQLPTNHQLIGPLFGGSQPGSGINRLVNFSGLLTRDLESFISRFQDSEPTLTVVFEPRLISLETESSGGKAKSAETLAGKGAKHETPKGRVAGLGR